MSELKLTESSACRRIGVARLLARFPRIAGYLLASRLTLMGLGALKDVLDESNVDELLERAAGLSERDVRELVTRIQFGSAAPRASVEVSPNQIELATPPAARVAADSVATSMRNESQPAREEEQLEAMTLWVGREFRRELAAVRDLLSHAVPSGKREEVLLHALRAQRKVLERRRYGSPKPKKVAVAPTAAPANPRDVPAPMQREVFERVGGCCAYVGEDGRRCGSTFQLEFQHIIPVAQGGLTTPENLTLYCRAHNLFRRRRTSAKRT
jgi:hypothetical protein